jgi:DNA-binding MarR family transcriptional regulator
MANREQLRGEYATVMREFMASAVFFQDAVARAAGLNSTDLQALGILMAGGPSTPGELAERTGITAGGAITLLVDRLEAAGFAHRSRDQQDRRRVRVSADADQVAERLGPLYAPVAQEWDAYLATLTADALRIGLDMLRTAVDINENQIQRMALRPGAG